MRESVVGWGGEAIHSLAVSKIQEPPQNHCKYRICSHVFTLLEMAFGLFCNNSYRNLKEFSYIK